MDGDGRSPSPAARSPRLFLGARAERWLYALVAGAATLWVACLFYASLRLQTSYTGTLPLAKPGEWSAPLDDVFIHFDFARAIARGHPFEWSEGNGYSSGGTSLLYPFVLAFGYWVGFRRMNLMIWAAIIACVSVLALLLGSRRLFRDLPRWTSYLLLPALLGVGVLDWSFFSGMEVALFLAVWVGTLIAWDDLLRGPPDAAPPPRPGRMALLLGVWGGFLVATRPEAAVLVALFSLSAGAVIRQRHGTRRALRAVLFSALPGAFMVIGHAVLNKIYTGDSTAAGALVKLEMYHPHLNRSQVLDAWWFHVKYQFMRVGDYHLSDVRGVGFIPYVLALVSLVPRTTRRYGAMLVGSTVIWVAITALNGQVRWQNERYVMPAVAWMLLAAALGTAVLIGKTWALGRRGKVLRVATTAIAVVAVGLSAYHQRSKFRDQVWFFGRASRNIRDQHMRVGRLLRLLEPRPHRVLVGDAGAIPYVSDLPALDIIGLGGYKRLPFDRATRLGIGAGIELLERIPPSDRPDLLAIYPSWWGTFPLWFGEVLAEVPVEGNVICGGAAKVLYRPHWSSFEGSDRPFATAPGERVADELDFADIVNEAAHQYVLDGAVGYVDMKLLPNPASPTKDVWDAGRIAPQGSRERFVLHHLAPRKPTRLLFRGAPAQPAEIMVSVNGHSIGKVFLPAREGWVEVPLMVPADVVKETSSVELTAERGEHVLHHLFVLQRP